MEKRILCSCSMNDTMFEYRQTRRVAQYNAMKSETRYTKRKRAAMSAGLDMENNSYMRVWIQETGVISYTEGNSENTPDTASGRIAREQRNERAKRVSGRKNQLPAEPEISESAPQLPFLSNC